MSNPFDRNPFRLPPPWNAGYALPQNVDDEGLERHAYTTAWAPRGSFDNPKVGTAGYAVPEYVQKEGYGVGAMVTRWAPRGSYAGPKVPHWLDKQSALVVGRKPLPGGATQLQIKALAGAEYSSTGGRDTPLTNYGLKTSGALIDAVKMMPPDLRESQLRKALDRVDPKLYAAGGQLASADAKAGLQPTAALQRGLALAMTTGMAKELVNLGKGSAPSKKTQLGAVCSRMGLGEDPVRAGFCWIAATATVPGHWERMRAGQTSCAGPQPAGVSAPTVRDQRGGTTSGGGVTVTDASGNVVRAPVRPPPPPEPPSDQKFLQIGPFLIPTNVGAYRDHRTLTDEKKAYVDQNIAIAAKSGGVSIAEMKTGKYPFVKFKSPNGEDWGLFYQESDGTQKTSRGTTIPAGTVVAYHKIAPSMLGNILGDAWDAVKDAAEWVGGAIASVFKKIWAGIKWVAAKVVDFVKAAAEFVKDAACKVFSSPVGQLAGAAAGAYVGGPAGAQAGAAGAQLIAQSCADAPPAPAELPQPPAGGMNLMPILLIGGAGVAAYLLLGGKKKH